MRYRITITYANDLTHNFHILSATPIKLQDIDLPKYVKENQTNAEGVTRSNLLEGVIGLHMRVLD